MLMLDSLKTSDWLASLNALVQCLSRAFFAYDCQVRSKSVIVTHWRTGPALIRKSWKPTATQGATGGWFWVANWMRWRPNLDWHQASFSRELYTFLAWGTFSASRPSSPPLAPLAGLSKRSQVLPALYGSCAAELPRCCQILALGTIVSAVQCTNALRHFQQYH